jgi:ribosomal protein L37AE/L43A
MQCPRCGCPDIKGENVKFGLYYCDSCGYSNKYLDFVYWDVKYSGDNAYLICN